MVTTGAGLFGHKDLLSTYWCQALNYCTFQPLAIGVFLGWFHIFLSFLSPLPGILNKTIDL